MRPTQLASNALDQFAQRFCIGCSTQTSLVTRISHRLVVNAGAAKCNNIQRKTPVLLAFALARLLATVGMHIIFPCVQAFRQSQIIRHYQTQTFQCPETV